MMAVPIRQINFAQMLRLALFSSALMMWVACTPSQETTDDRVSLEDLYDETLKPLMIK